MRSLVFIRIISLLKRIAIALEESNRLKREESQPMMRHTRQFQIGHPTIEQWEEAHKAREVRRGRAIPE